MNRCILARAITLQSLRHRCVIAAYHFMIAA
jgi:hypothetical protein